MNPRITKPKRIGLMGCGAVAAYGHVPAIQQTPGLVLHAIFDPNSDAVKSMQEAFGIPHAFTDSTAFFDSGIEAVSITSPAPCHKGNVLDAARYQLPVLCEKPLAMNSGEAREMIDAMEKAGVPFHAGFCYRFSPSSLKIRELVKSGAIGEVRSLRLIYNWNCHGKFVRDAAGNLSIQQRREGRMLEGGPVIDCGTHQIDLATFWLDSPVVHFTGHGAWVDDYEAPDHMWLHMDHASGAHTVVEISYSYHHTSANTHSEFVYELIGRDGVIRYDRTAESFTMENGNGLQEFEFHPEKSFEGMYSEWAAALQTGRSDLLTSAVDGTRVVEIAAAATAEAIRNRGSGCPQGLTKINS